MRTRDERRPLLRRTAIAPTTLNDATRFNPSQRRCMAIPRVRSAYTALQNPINAYFVARRNASSEVRANAAPATNEATKPDQRLFRSAA